MHLVRPINFLFSSSFGSGGEWRPVVGVYRPAFGVQRPMTAAGRRSSWSLAAGGRTSDRQWPTAGPTTCGGQRAVGTSSGDWQLKRKKNKRNTFLEIVPNNKKLLFSTSCFYSLE